MKYPDMIPQMDVSAFIVVFAQALAFVSVLLLLALLVVLAVEAFRKDIDGEDFKIDTRRTASILSVLLVPAALTVVVVLCALAGVIFK